MNKEIEKKWSNIIAMDLDEMNELRSMVSNGLETEGSEDLIRMFLQDLQMIKSEATIELLRLKLSEKDETKEGVEQ
jgi:hypothetical protein